jgi:hypothetical protein
MSRRVSRLTLKGIFLITIAVGMTSSSAFWLGLAAIGGDERWAIGGGEPPAEEKSELLWGESERLSELSSHCLKIVRKIGGKSTRSHTWGSAARMGLDLSGDWPTVRGLYWDWTGMPGEVAKWYWGLLALLLLS